MRRVPIGCVVAACPLAGCSSGPSAQELAKQPCDTFSSAAAPRPIDFTKVSAEMSRAADIAARAALKDQRWDALERAFSDLTDYYKGMAEPPDASVRTDAQQADLNLVLSKAATACWCS